MNPNITRHNTLLEKSKSHKIKSFDAYLSHRTLPINLTQKDRHKFIHEQTRIIPECVASLEEDLYIANNFDLFGSPFQTKYEKHATAGATTPKRKALRYLNRLRAVASSISVDRGIWAIDNWSGGYFHWLIDALSRIELASDYWDSYPVILPNHYKEIPFISASLEILEIPYTYIHKGGSCRVRSLIVTSHTAPTGNANKEVLKILVDRFRAWANSQIRTNYMGRKEGRKLYVSRALAYRRKISNEAEIIPILIENGFEIVFTENMTFQEQVMLFSSASAIAGMHGAGLTNMIFMPSQSSVIEIRNSHDSNNNCYFTLASDLEHRYYYQMASPDGIDLNHANCHVSSSEIQHLLKSLPK